MTQTQHTPGPWSMDPEGEHATHIESGSGLVVATVHHLDRRDEQQAEANARLIAAAPDLLKLAHAVLKSEQEARSERWGLGDYMEYLDWIAQDAAKAITAATGTT